jgi:hypothetical protein
MLYAASPDLQVAEIPFGSGNKVREAEINDSFALRMPRFPIQYSHSDGEHTRGEMRIDLRKPHTLRQSG